MSYIDSLFSLKEKTVLLTGATGYFGKVFTNTLLEVGAAIVIFGRGKKIEDLSRSLGNKYDVVYYDVDLYDTERFKECLIDTVRTHTIDILINNAYDFSKETGFNDPSGSLEDISYEQWMKGLESGIYWPALTTQIVGSSMKDRGYGSIINISSMYGIVSPHPDLYEGIDTVNPPSYGASKAAILALTRYTAAFLGKYGVRCNAIVPGAFPNTIGGTYNSPKDTTVLDRLSARTLLGRYGVPQDLVGVLLLLASDASSYITGQSIVVDGGWTTT